MNLNWHSRMEFPRILNDLGLKGIGVEVGTHLGDFASFIRRHWEGSLLICVDPWDAPKNGIAGAERCRMAGQALKSVGGEFTLVPKTSAAAAAEFASVGVRLDWVYIDGLHDFANVLVDIDAWWPLVKPGGIIAGHDWVVDGWHMPDVPLVASDTRTDEGEWFGVRKATLERFGIEQLHVTSPNADGGWLSWLVRKAAP